MEALWLNDLNETQRAAVQHVDGPLLIIAGAGSGKTRVLTYRIAYLLERGVSPEAILAVTFTNKAATEMRERVSALIGPRAQHVWVGTFHSMCVRILRRYADRLGFPNQFLIFDTADQLAAVRAVLKDLDLDPKRHDPRSLLGAISAAKNNLQEPREYAEAASDYWERVAARVYERYQEKLRENGAFDFDDLLLATVRLFRQEPDVLAHYRAKFQYLMVDEYQDTNRVQYVLVNMLAEDHRNLCVVGDADQSIYRFRGADIRNILDFERDYPDATVIKLEQNYRSTKRILDAANAVIANNLDRPAKELWTDNPEGAPLYFYQAMDERGEAGFIADEIRRAIADDGRQYSDFTILYRTHAQSRTFEEEFIRRGIPYRIVSGVRFYERKEIKDLLAYLRVIYNPLDEFSLRRIINVPRRGIGDVTIGRLDEFAAVNGMSLFEALSDPDALAELSTAAANRVQEFARLIEDLARSGQRRVVDGAGRPGAGALGLHAGAARRANHRGRGAGRKLAGVFVGDAPVRAGARRRAGRVSRTCGPGVGRGRVRRRRPLGHHDDAARGQGLGVSRRVSRRHGGRRVSAFPGAGRSQRAGGGAAPLLRRHDPGHGAAVFDVRRAQRMLYGQPVAGAVSLFVNEIPADLIEDVSETMRARAVRAGWQVLDGGRASGGGSAQGRAPGGPVAFGPADLRPASAGASAPGEPAGGGPRTTVDPGSLQTGDRVRHKVFGEGTVVSCTRAGGDTVVTVAFPNQGVKKLLASVAPLEKV